MDYYDQQAVPFELFRKGCDIPPILKNVMNMIASMAGSVWSSRCWQEIRSGTVSECLTAACLADYCVAARRPRSIDDEYLMKYIKKYRS